MPTKDRERKRGEPPSKTKPMGKKVGRGGKATCSTGMPEETEMEKQTKR